jgi:hypothetical protein
VDLEERPLLLSIFSRRNIDTVLASEFLLAET